MIAQKHFTKKKIPMEKKKILQYFIVSRDTTVKYEI